MNKGNHRHSPVSGEIIYRFSYHPTPHKRHCNIVNHYLLITWLRQYFNLDQHSISTQNQKGTINKSKQGVWGRFKTIYMCICIRMMLLETQRACDAIITLLWHRNDVTTSFWRHKNVFIASRVPWGWKAMVHSTKYSDILYHQLGLWFVATLRYHQLRTCNFRKRNEQKMEGDEKKRWFVSFIDDADGDFELLIPTWIKLTS